MKMVDLARTLVVFLVLFANGLLAQTCDLEFISYNPINHEIEVAFLDATNCGCNEYTLQDGNTCENSSSTHVNNNEDVTNLVIGLHYDDFDVVPGDYGCEASTWYHPGWTYVVVYNEDEGWQTGDTAKFELNPGYGWECILNNPLEDICWEVVIWQINLSQTVSPDDFPTEFWTDTCGTCANQTQMYPDIDLSNNSLVFCPGDVFEVYGCMYEDALNFDELATIDDGSCEYEDCPIYGCMNPIACNYNQFADTNDNSCVFCDTPGGEEICNEYHNSETYWDWYVSLFNCEEIEEPCDTIIEYLYDTLIITVPEVIYDTLTIIDVVDSLIFITDTVYVDNFIYITVFDTSFIYTTIFDTVYIELPPDTVIVTETEFIVDTLYIDNFIYTTIFDTLYIDNYIYEYDTTYVTEMDTLYLTLTDTITEYIVQELWIDCNTGLPCDEEPPGIECPGWTTLHIPNTFTPNNDGLNDTWQIKYDLGCWEDVEFEIYNRWGNKIYHGYGDSFDSYPYWDGSINGGNHYAQDGIYVYLVKGKKVGRAEVVKKQGYISIFR